MATGSELIVGFDILPSSSPHSKSRMKFACAVIKNGTVLNEHSQITRRMLLRLVRELKPKYLATDNVFEIVPDAKSIFNLAKRMPPETKIVQVTGIPPKQISLKRLARQYKLPIRGKPSPLESARLSAQLASMGAGYALECFSEQTEIKVTRGRKMGKGGQSANRYRRRIHSEIQQMTRHIETQMKTAEIEYDIDVRESDFGYSSSRIIAYAPIPRIKDLIEAKRGGNYNVLISPVRKRTEFIPLEPKPIPTQMSPHYFILGVDPGTTAAICLLTFRGKIHLLTSKKGLTRADIIRLVYEHGVPVMIACDTRPAPHLVKKLSSTLNAELFEPNRNIAVSDKQEIAREYAESIKIGNAHERDALTAAVYAHRSVLPKLDQIDRKVREEQLAVDREHLKALVVRGAPMNEAITSLTKELAEEVEVISEQKAEEEKSLFTLESFVALKHKNEELETEKVHLLDKIEDFERTVEYLKFREEELAYSLDIVNRENYWKVKRDREVAKKQAQVDGLKHDNRKLRRNISRLRKRLELLRGVRRLELSGDMIAIKTITHFTREAIDDYMKEFGLKKDDIVLFEDASGGGPQTARILIEKEIRAVIADTPISHLAEDELVRAIIPVIDGQKVKLKRVDGFAFIERKSFEEQMTHFKNMVKEEARKKGEEDLIQIVEKYQREIDR